MTEIVSTKISLRGDGLEHLTGERRKQLESLLRLVTSCYVEGATNKLALIAHTEHSPCSVFGVNADSFEVTGLVHEAHTLLGVHHMNEKEAWGALQ